MEISSTCKAKPRKTGLTGEPGESGLNWINPIRERLDELCINGA